MNRLLAIATLVTCSCSFLTVQGPPDAPRPPEYSCTEGGVAPLVDLGGTVGFGAVAGAAAADGADVDTVAVLGAGAAVFLASAIVGYSRQNACRAARAEQGWRTR
jgi:hypothetical protein